VQFLTWHVEHLARPLVAEAVGLGNGDHAVDDRRRELDLRGVLVPDRRLRRRRHRDMCCICRLPRMLLEQRNHRQNSVWLWVSVRSVHSVQTLTLQQWNVVGGVAVKHEGFGLLEAVALLVRLQHQLLHNHLLETGTARCQRRRNPRSSGVLLRRRRAIPGR